MTIRNLVTQKGPGAANAFHIAYGEEGADNGGQWPAKTLRISGWTAATVANAANRFATAAYAAGIWDATGGLVPATGVSVFGVPLRRMVLRGAYGATVPGPLPGGVAALPGMPAIDAAPPVR